MGPLSKIQLFVIGTDRPSKNHDFVRHILWMSTIAGTMNGVCSGLCTCKRNVEGRRCDRCKRGFFALYESHSKGCLECFCNGITDQCETADLGIELLQHAEGWKVTDLRGRLLVEPYWSTLTNGVTVAEEDMQGINKNPINYILLQKFPRFYLIFTISTIFLHIY